MYQIKWIASESDNVFDRWFMNKVCRRGISFVISVGNTEDSKHHKADNIALNNDHRAWIMDLTDPRKWLDCKRSKSLQRLHASTSQPVWQELQYKFTVYNSPPTQICQPSICVFSLLVTQLLMNWLWQQFPGAAGWASAKQPSCLWRVL